MENNSQFTEYRLPDPTSPYWIDSSLEIRQLLKSISKKLEKVTVWTGIPGEFFVSLILEVSDSGEVMLDMGIDRKVNAKALSVSKLLVSASIDKVDIKFEVLNPKEKKFEGSPAILVKIPARVHKLQRREFYRIPTPIGKPLFATLNFEESNVVQNTSITSSTTIDNKADQKTVKASDNSNIFKNVQVQVSDISLGGVCLLDPGLKDATISGGTTLRAGSILLPEFGQIRFDLFVCHVFEVEGRNGVKKRRLGCKFVGLSHADQTLVQRYMTKLERDRRAVA